MSGINPTTPKTQPGSSPGAQPPASQPRPKSSFKSPPPCSTSGTSTSASGMRSPQVTNVVVQNNQTNTKHGVVIPRVGGVLTLDVVKDEGEAFTGGSNIIPSTPLPLFTNQRCPTKYGAIVDFTTLLEKGTPYKLSSPNEKDNGTSIPNSSRRLPISWKIMD